MELDRENSSFEKFSTERETEYSLHREGVLTPQSDGQTDSSSPIDSEYGSKRGVFKSKSALRIKYDAEVTLMRKKYGELEDIRNLLGLSRRKVCQLLLVDPSAWNRWTQQKNRDAPPHIYRSLEWFLLLQEKNPTLDQRFWLSQITNPVAPMKDPVVQQQQQLQAEQFRDDIQFLKKILPMHAATKPEVRLAGLVLFLLAGLLLGWFLATHLKTF